MGREEKRRGKEAERGGKGSKGAVERICVGCCDDEDEIWRKRRREGASSV